MTASQARLSALEAAAKIAEEEALNCASVYSQHVGLRIAQRIREMGKDSHHVATD